MNAPTTISNEESQDNSKSGYNRVKADVLKLYRALKNFAIYIFPILFLLFTGIFGLLEAAGIDTGVPEHLVGYTIYWGYGVWFGLLPAAVVHKLISSDDDPRVFTYDVESSLLALWKFPKKRLFGSTTVMSPDGEEMTVDDLDQIHTQEYGQCYLALGYDEDADVLIASWFAGMNPVELRARKKQLVKALNVLWKLVDSAVEVVANRESISREAAYQEVLANIEMREHINLESSTAQTNIEAILDESGLSNDVIEEIKKQYDDPESDLNTSNLGDN